MAVADLPLQIRRALWLVGCPACGAMETDAEREVARRNRAFRRRRLLAMAMPVLALAGVVVGLFLSRSELSHSLLLGGVIGGCGAAVGGALLAFVTWPYGRAPLPRAEVWLPPAQVHEVTQAETGPGDWRRLPFPPISRFSFRWFACGMTVVIVGGTVGVVTSIAYGAQFSTVHLALERAPGTPITLQQPTEDPLFIRAVDCGDRRCVYRASLRGSSPPTLSVTSPEGAVATYAIPPHPGGAAIVVEGARREDFCVYEEQLVFGKPPESVKPVPRRRLHNQGDVFLTSCFPDYLFEKVPDSVPLEKGEGFRRVCVVDGALCKSLAPDAGSAETH
jgi:hypothetical protein